MSMDFKKILFDVDYQNYTLSQLICCYDKLDAEAFARLNRFFSLTRERILEHRNSLVECEGGPTIYYGFALVKPETPKKANPQDERTAKTLAENLARLEAETEAEGNTLSEKENAFLTCMKTLIAVFPYLSPEEMYLINEHLEMVILFDYSISPELEVRGNPFFYPSFKTRFMK